MILNSEDKSFIFLENVKFIIITNIQNSDLKEAKISIRLFKKLHEIWIKLGRLLAFLY